MRATKKAKEGGRQEGRVEWKTAKNNHGEKEGKRENGTAVQAVTQKAAARLVHSRGKIKALRARPKYSVTMVVAVVKYNLVVTKYA